MEQLQLRRVYKHFSGKEVIILGFGIIADSNEQAVIFSSLTAGEEENVKILAISKWHSMATVNGKQVKRYTLKD